MSPNLRSSCCIKYLLDKSQSDRPCHPDPGAADEEEDDAKMSARLPLQVSPCCTFRIAVLVNRCLNLNLNPIQDLKLTIENEIFCNRAITPTSAELETQPLSGPGTMPAAKAGAEAVAATAMQLHVQPSRMPGSRIQAGRSLPAIRTQAIAMAEASTFFIL